MSQGPPVLLSILFILIQSPVFARMSSLNLINRDVRGPVSTITKTSAKMSAEDGTTKGRTSKTTNDRVSKERRETPWNELSCEERNKIDHEQWLNDSGDDYGPNDQGDDIPDDPVDLPTLSISLTNDEDWHRWSTIVKATLQGQSLGQLVDSKLYRPLRDGSAKARRWAMASKAVAFWMLENVHPDKQSAVRSRPSYATYADNVFNALEENCCGGGKYAQRRAYWNFWKAIDSSECANVGDYVLQFRDAYIRAREMGAVFDHHMLTLLFLMGANRFDEYVVGRIMERLETQDKAISKFDANDMRDVMNDLRHYMNRK